MALSPSAPATPNEASRSPDLEEASSNKATSSSPAVAKVGMRLRYVKPGFEKADAVNHRSRKGAKLFQCSGFGDCKMAFSRSEHLSRHVRKHTGERPFHCNCGRAFSRLDNLRQHVHTVHAKEPHKYPTLKNVVTVNTSKLVLNIDATSPVTKAPIYASPKPTESAAQDSQVAVGSVPALVHTSESSSTSEHSDSGDSNVTTPRSESVPQLPPVNPNLALAPNQGPVSVAVVPGQVKPEAPPMCAMAPRVLGCPQGAVPTIPVIMCWDSSQSMYSPVQSLHYGPGFVPQGNVQIPYTFAPVPSVTLAAMPYDAFIQQH